MVGTAKELYKITINHFNYELNNIGYNWNRETTGKKDSMVRRDFVSDIRRIVKNAMNKSTKVYSNITYETVCNDIITELLTE